MIIVFSICIQHKSTYSSSHSTYFLLQKRQSHGAPIEALLRVSPALRTVERRPPKMHPFGAPAIAMSRNIQNNNNSSNGDADAAANVICEGTEALSLSSTEEQSVSVCVWPTALPKRLAESPSPGLSPGPFSWGVLPMSWPPPV